VVAAVKDPLRLAATLRALGLPHPEMRLATPTGEGWLRKRIGGSGGGHVRKGSAATPGYNFQRRVPGRPVSVLFIADGRHARTVGFSAQWCNPTAEQPFRYGGCVAPAGLGMRLEAALAEACSAIVRATGLIGLNSLDLLIEEDGFHCIEINPRPGATLDIFDGSGALRLWPVHLAGVGGALAEVPAPSAEARAAALVYAWCRLVVPADFPWPVWTADRSIPGTVIGPGDPVCTVLAQAATAHEAEDAVNERATEILAALGSP
jgi:predicted ATP-grasp superfamily ATP-dependent carboligase